MPSMMAARSVLGPFVSLAECDRAIRDRLQRIIPKVPD